MLSALRGHVACFEVVLWRCGDATYYSVLKSKTLSVLLQYYSVLQSTTLYYKVRRQYYSVLQSTTPVLLRYYSVLQSTTPVLLCTTKYYQYYSSTTLYYKVLLQYYSVLQSTTPVLLYQILRLPRNSEFRIAAQNPWIASANIKTIRG